MNVRSVAVLGGITVVIIVAAAVAVHRTSTEETASDAVADSDLLAGVADNLQNNFGGLKIETRDDTFTIHKDGDHWGMVEKGGFSVDVDRISRMVNSLQLMEVVEKKTSNPANFKKLGVDDPKDKESPAARITLLDKQYKPFATYIFGKSTWLANEAHMYVRRDGENQVWLVKLPNIISAQGDKKYWLKREIMKIKGEDIRSVTIKKSGKTLLEMMRDFPENKTFTLLNIPEGKKLERDSELTQIANTLSPLNLDDVMLVTTAPQIPSMSSTAVFTTFDGLVVTATVCNAEGKYYATFKARYDSARRAEVEQAVAARDANQKVDDSDKEDKDKKDKKNNTSESGNKPAPKKLKLLPVDDVKAKADAINAMNKWAFVLPSWKGANFSKRTSDLVVDVVSVRQILVSWKGATDSTVTNRTKAQAKQRADEIRKRVTDGGEDFVTVAKKESDDKKTVFKNGNQAEVVKGKSIKPFDEKVLDAAAFKLKPGEVSRVIETKYGFHILKRTR